MNKTSDLFSDIYPAVNQLEMFVHPETGLIYSMLTDSQLLILAEKTLDTLLNMNIVQVIVSESGAVPFARICAWIGRKKKLQFQWYAIKIPRDLEDTFTMTLQTYSSLTLDELKLPEDFHQNPLSFSFIRHGDATVPDDYFSKGEKTLATILETLDEEIDHHEYINNNQSCGLTQILKEPFIFFDEYIDSGKTLFQSFRFFKLFGQSLQFKIFSYLIKLPKMSLNNARIQSLYTLDNEHEAYQWGVYPYENRIDLNGYYYSITATTFHKIALHELCDYEYSQPLSSSLLGDFLKIINQETLLADVRKACQVPPVSAFINQHHLIQYCLYQLEIMHYGKNPISELLYQLFDLYGPIWSPLPDQYHLSYLEAFEQIPINQLLATTTIEQQYRTLRLYIIQNIAKILEERHIHQQKNLYNHLEKHYES